MALWNHLDELRSRLLKVLLVIALLALISFWATDWILQWLLKPFSFATLSLTSLKPADVFVQSMRLSLLGGLILGFPILSYQVWSFIAPGLSKAEKKVVLIILCCGTFLFGLGVFFAYFLVVPKALAFFWGYSHDLGVQPTWTIEHYLNFVLMFLLSFGVAFELPLVLVSLVRFKIVSVEWLSEKRPIIIICLAILAAILTPPDVVSMLMLGIPLWLLFEISVLVAKI
ncbi:MAG: twin arginine-targeting protein translocase TatC [Deltaproteobacteria bacterium RIFCSPLOWO2_12_FULL_44_12]|nr:MAG: twin arginine-targeting protein translocase TatC [Deltaproteobacteria bacterium RIFCSPHIGHO2_01_FULL_43_49]OGQ16520.1 MAG: twin arginine-targeting protein translocase TatC [Deltaproteobacteria bacterium RIFCSPHIGHO2_02_FULL_44_53]OGQ28337.1 MAG: twin arginine-targeting protein translocase TatC [Deltaproteobacteria bacterium RIFCSPHIGHO2_12_FULL_44_21]OGQ32408.1 MAG: twin arginine-targeting protein translocase TatC [Deltaproteobacteria bacterium RIFCSPLOWO2_01_FULL_45_74]OGQ41533.1 MAG: 